MGFIQELADLIGKLRFYDIVYEYQQGIYLSNGRVIEKHRRNIPKEEMERIKEKEIEFKKMVGRYYFLPFRRPELPSEYRKSVITGRPRHKDRYRKILDDGPYLFFPILQDIVKESKQERTLNLGNVTMQTSDLESKTMMLSCNARIEVLNLYKLYTAVHDYEDSFEFEVLSKLYSAATEKTFKEIISKAGQKAILTETINSVKKIVTEKWGLKVHDLAITDCVICTILRISHDGQPVNIKSENNFIGLANQGGLF